MESAWLWANKFQERERKRRFSRTFSVTQPFRSVSFFFAAAAAITPDVLPVSRGFYCRGNRKTGSRSDKNTREIKLSFYPVRNVVFYNKRWNIHGRLYGGATFYIRCTHVGFWLAAGCESCLCLFRSESEIFAWAKSARRTVTFFISGDRGGNKLRLGSTMFRRVTSRGNFLSVKFPRDSESFFFSIGRSSERETAGEREREREEEKTRWTGRWRKELAIDRLAVIIGRGRETIEFARGK